VDAPVLEIMNIPSYYLPAIAILSEFPYASSVTILKYNIIYLVQVKQLTLAVTFAFSKSASVLTLFPEILSEFEKKLWKASSSFSFC
jgi:hypothetical protein